LNPFAFKNFWLPADVLLVAVSARRPAPVRIAVNVAALCAGAFIAFSGLDWHSLDVPLLLALAACAVASDLQAMRTGAAKVRISGSFLALIIAMVFLGPAPAAVLGLIAVAVGWFGSREEPHYLLSNLAAYCWFPFVGAQAFAAARDGLSLQPSDPAYYLLVFALFFVSLALNFAWVALYSSHMTGEPIVQMTRRVLPPVLPSELVSAVFAVALVKFYDTLGLVALVFFALLLGTFQYILRELLRSQQRSDQLASFQVGMLSTLVHTLDLRDRMTARHSAAVARYAREIARAAGCTDEELELVHTAGLLHDLGKFVFPDSILKGGGKLSDDDWEIVKSHPEQGARLVAQIDGYGPVAEIILAHHERIDGTGYPHGIHGERIPKLARMISVADTYDVMTARDSYREPVTSEAALAELRRVSGTQLDAEYVELFAELLGASGVAFQHAEDADFDRELQIERRVRAYASPVRAAV
jgi:putative nucleotidyltransferase with HDIG domain